MVRSSPLRLRNLVWLPAAMALAGCSVQALRTTPDAGTDAAGFLRADAARATGKLDLLFMIDNSSEMSFAQRKLTQAVASFVARLEQLPGGLPDLHLAVVSSDMGAPGDSSASIGCTPAGDQGQFQFAARNDCAATGLDPGATFLASDGVRANYTGQLSDVVSCIAALGANGCGFEHQLASVGRALGADGLGPPPDGNVGFLRPDAELAVLMLSNEDDCSAPADTTLFSLNGAGQDNQNPLGPIANYRCNRWGHLCHDPRSADPDALITPPQTVPEDAAGDPPALTLTGCISNDGPSGMLTPVRTFVDGLRALKSDPSRIVVGAIVAPPEPVAVAWIPPVNASVAGSSQLWPQVYHSCGWPGSPGLNPAATQAVQDGSFGDPPVRIAQWVRAFGDNGLLSSVCDASYAESLQQFASLIAAHL